MENDERLENEFAAVRETMRRFGPAPMGEALTGRLTGAADERLTVADRIFALWTAAGAMAACVVAVMTVWQFAAAPVQTTVTPQQMAIHQQAAAEYQKMVASR